MELLDATKTRRSTREFTGKRIPDEDVEKILDAARCAFSGKPADVTIHNY
jgi:nitroreductase